VIASQASDVGSIPIARSINPENHVDAASLTGFPSPSRSQKLDAKLTPKRVLDADFRSLRQYWEQLSDNARRQALARNHGRFEFACSGLGTNHIAIATIWGDRPDDSNGLTWLSWLNPA
jgi:hypothetical protein